MRSFTPSTTIHALGENFYDPVAPAAFNLVATRYFDAPLARSLGLDLSPEQVVEHFLQFKPLPGSLPEPLALRYHGHQFRHYNPDLGDGRGFLFAQCERDGRLLDFGTKGSGTTPWSRRGDGRLTLLGGVREVLAANYLASMGVNTSRAFTLIETDESLQRSDEPSPTRAAVLTRLSHSHIRFGTFQRQAFHGARENLEQLVEYCIRHFYSDASNAAEMFDQVVTASADTVASWMAAGFVHGVMNTDNMNITGESFDYGPYRFLPHLDPAFTAAYFDHQGLYAYGQQPDAMAWNLAQLAQSLSLVCEDAPLIAALQDYPDRYERALSRHVLRRLGLRSISPDADMQLVRETFNYLGQSRVAWPQFWHDWAGGADRSDGHGANAYAGEIFNSWLKLLKTFEVENTFEDQAPLSSLLYEEIGDIWKPIDEDDDWSAFEQKNVSFQTPQ